jgi:hypothetical protein
VILVVSAMSAQAEEVSTFARWGENSGSLPPEYAWDYTVHFQDDRRVEVTYCKGYAEAAPGCATATTRLSKKKYAALIEALTPLAADLAAHPAKDAADIPVGGGSIYGRITLNGDDIALPAFVAEEDGARVKAVLDLLQAATPPQTILNAKSRAKQP